MMLLHLPRISDGTALVGVEHTDYGDSVECRDKDGKPFHAFTSLFVIDGKRYYCIWKDENQTWSAQERFKFECEFLKALDVRMDALA